MVMLEAERDAHARRAGDMAELAGIIVSARDKLAEIMISAQARALGLDKPIASVRLQLSSAEECANAAALQHASACETLTRHVGPPAASPVGNPDAADTRPMSVEEIAEINSEDDG